MASKKLYDLIVFGATGFTGKFVAEEIHRIQSSNIRSNLKWAVAGRNTTKVTATMNELDIHGVDIIQADVQNEESIVEMCAKTRVLVDVVGPYIKYGEVVIRSCIKGKCDYVDITGEEYFVEKMMAKYGDEAERAGIYIVNYCGLDSVPSDIGAVMLRDHFDGNLEHVECYISAKTEVLNTGTWESALGIIRTTNKLNKFRKELKNCRLLSPQPHTTIPKRWPVFYSNVTQSWCVPFDGADKSSIRRTGFYHGDVRGTPNVACNVYFSVGSFLRLMVTAFVLMFIVPLNMTSWGFKLLCKYPRLFTLGHFSHSGPTKEQIARASFTVTLDGASIKGQRKARVVVQGAEPAYVSTSVMMVHCAMCLLEERDKLPKRGGIYTPGMAFGDTSIIKRIEDTGKVKFTVKDL